MAPGRPALLPVALKSCAMAMAWTWDDGWVRVPFLSQGPMALWTGPSMLLPVLRAAFVESVFGSFWRPYFWDGRIHYFQVDLILEIGHLSSRHLSSKNGVHYPSLILHYFCLTDGRSNLWSWGCFKASQGKITANQLVPHIIVWGSCF